MVLALLGGLLARLDGDERWLAWLDVGIGRVVGEKTGERGSVFGPRPRGLSSFPEMAAERTMAHQHGLHRLDSVIAEWTRAHQLGFFRICFLPVWKCRVVGRIVAM